MIRIHAQQVAIPSDVPFHDPDLAAELFTVLREATRTADREGAPRFVVHLPDQRDFAVSSVPPADPAELHLVCVPHRDPLLLRGLDYHLVTTSGRARRERRAG